MAHLRPRPAPPQPADKPDGQLLLDLPVVLGGRSPAPVGRVVGRGPGVPHVAPGAGREFPEGAHLDVRVGFSPEQGEARKNRFPAQGYHVRALALLRAADAGAAGAGLAAPGGRLRQITFEGGSMATR